jgi:hypothetical protein
MRAGNGRVPAAVLETWAVYHRLRQLAVPLVLLEEERSKTYRTVTLKERIRSVEEQQPAGTGCVGAYLDSRWPKVVKILRATYDLFLGMKEPAKFYTLASAVEERLKATDSREVPLRIVAPTVHEGSMVAGLLGQLVSGWAEALQEGAVTITSAREEPRLIAEGCVRTTMLLGFRTSDTRYLDVYPGVVVHVVSYPYEAEVDESIQRRVHASIEQLQENTSRTTLLRSLRLPVSPAEPAGPLPRHGADLNPRTPRAHVHHRGEVRTGRPTARRLQDGESVEPLDIVKLAGLTWWDDLVVGAVEPVGGALGGGGRSPVEVVEVADTAGGRVRYPATRLLDVFYPATEIKERVPARDLQPGMLMVVLVDDPYEDLFHRLVEGIREQRDVRASLALDLWQHAKRAALTRHGGVRRRLHDALATEGLTVEYEAVVGWYIGGEKEILAPEKRADFTLLARSSGVYTDDVVIDRTLACIESERTARRKYGKILSRLLTHIATGQNFEIALKSAKALGTPVEHIATAVVLREVESVRTVGKLSELVA